MSNNEVIFYFGYSTFLCSIFYIFSPPSRWTVLFQKIGVEA